MSQSSSRCSPSWAQVESANPGQTNLLFDVDALSSSDVWAVGRTGGLETALPITEHWDGERWTFITDDPSFHPEDSKLVGVRGVSPTDVWAVGYSIQSVQEGDPPYPLIERWNGRRWRVVPSPSVAGGLGGLTVVSARDIWAVGVLAERLSPALAEHWDGRAWTTVPTPGIPDGAASLASAAAVASDDVWAVGYWGTVGSSTRHPLIEHWDGQAWSIQEIPEPVDGGILWAVAAAGPDDVWAVGGDGLTEHWDGKAWSIVPSEDLGGNGVDLYGIAAVSSGDVWAVGSWNPSAGGGSLLEHWDGRTWSLVWLRKDQGALSGVAAASHSYLWAVGEEGDIAFPVDTLTLRLCPELVADSGFHSQVLATQAGQGISWRFGAANGEGHSLTDGTEMGLFDSGIRRARDSFTYRFAAAGTYSVLDSTTGSAQSVAIPVQGHPGKGTEGTRFLIRWAIEAPPIGLAYDVQIKRPTDMRFRWWRRGTAVRLGGFTPDAGGGTYRFRARLRNVGTDAHSDWSPACRITVELSPRGGP